QTMERLGAEEAYSFSPAYFAGLAELVEAHGWLLVAGQEQEWVGAAVFFRSAVWGHYHLSAAPPGLRVPGAPNMVIHRAVELGQAAGLERLHVGGGRTPAPDDSLLRFKQSMGTDRHRFRIGRRVHHAEAYARFRALWAAAYPELVDKYGQRILCYRM